MPVPQIPGDELSFSKSFASTPKLNLNGGKEVVSDRVQRSYAFPFTAKRKRKRIKKMERLLMCECILKVLDVAFFENQIKLKTG